MLILFMILVIVAAFVLGLIVLIQNPKGGGLSGTFGGISTQLMGVKQTTDVLEKGTWIFAAVIGVLCLFSTFFIKGNTVSAADQPRNNAGEAPVPTHTTAPVQQTPPNTIPLPPGK